MMDDYVAELERRLVAAADAHARARAAGGMPARRHAGRRTGAAVRRLRRGVLASGRRRTTLLAVIVGLAGAAIPVMAATGTLGLRSTVVPATGTGPNGISPRLESAFAVLRRTHRPADEMPLPRGMKLPRDIHPGSVLHGLTLANGSSLWIGRFVGRQPNGDPMDGLCVMELEAPDPPRPASMSNGCGPVTTRMLREGTVMTGASGTADGMRTYDVYGLAPWSARDVRVRLADGRTMPVPLRDNVFGIHLTTKPVRLSWDGPYGPVVHALGDLDFPYASARGRAALRSLSPGSRGGRDASGRAR